MVVKSASTPAGQDAAPAAGRVTKCTGRPSAAYKGKAELPPLLGAGFIGKAFKHRPAEEQHTRTITHVHVLQNMHGLLCLSCFPLSLGETPLFFGQQHC